MNHKSLFRKPVSFSVSESGATTFILDQVDNEGKYTQNDLNQIHYNVRIALHFLNWVYCQVRIKLYFLGQLDSQ